MKKFIQNGIGISWSLFLLLTLFILCGEPPIGADPDLDKYHQETQMLLGGWVITLGMSILFTCFHYMVKDRDNSPKKLNP